MDPYNRRHFTMGTMNLDYMKETFNAIVASAEPTALPDFFTWIHHIVAEYKCNGYMYSGRLNSRYESSSGYHADMSHREQRSPYGMSPDTTVQTEALELTKSQEKSKTQQPEAYRPSNPQDFYKNTSKISNDIAYPQKTQPAYTYHHSPVYGSEASGIINLSIKSSHSEEAKTDIAARLPLKLALKVPTMYTANSPAKPPATSPTSPLPLKSEPSKDTYSSLRTLLEARKVGDLPTSTAAVCASPIKSSDAESNASSPGPDKDLKKTQCPHCDKTFQYRSSFRRHLKIHQGVYTHICAACARKFTRKEHFVRHKCNRKPNIPNRSASRVEMTPDARLPSSKLPQPKVAYPPTLDGHHQVSSMMAAAAYSPAKNLTEAFLAYQPALAQSENIKTEDKDEGMHTAAVCNESRRKKAQPRKLIVDDVAASGQGYIDEDLLKAYESPVHTPVTNEAGSEDAPSSPEDLSMGHNDEHTTDERYPQQLVKPIEIIPDTISTTTGTYQIEQVEDEDNCIKVTKQSNYLKLRKDAQEVNGKLQFTCPHCKKVFDCSSNFSRHMRTHRGVPAYICSSCKRGFNRREHFQKHKCARQAMSRVGERKTKLDMAAAITSDGEKENLSDGLSDEGGVEAGMELGADDYESSEEGELVVDESADMEEEEEDLASMNSPLPPPVSA